MNYNIQKSYCYILLLLIFLLFVGCEYQTKAEPKDVFESFIKAIYDKDEKAILTLIHPNSRDIFSSEIGKQIKWYESLRNNTKQSKPKFLRLDWIKRGSLVKVVYTHSENLEDYLPMILQEDKWLIDIGNNKQAPVNFREIERFVPGK